MSKYIFAWLFFLISFAFPPLLILSVGILVMLARRDLRILRYKRRATKLYFQHRDIMAVGNIGRKR